MHVLSINSISWKHNVIVPSPHNELVINNFISSRKPQIFIAIIKSYIYVKMWHSFHDHLYKNTCVVLFMYIWSVIYTHMATVSMINCYERIPRMHCSFLSFVVVVYTVPSSLLLAVMVAWLSNAAWQVICNNSNVL